jgi:hypothetical protein
LRFVRSRDSIKANRTWAISPTGISRRYHGQFLAVSMDRQPQRRRRPALSCLECRRRKIKCDREDPCKHCSIAKYHCTYRVYDNEPAARQQPQRADAGTPIPSSSSLPAPTLPQLPRTGTTTSNTEVTVDAPLPQTISAHGSVGEVARNAHRPGHSRSTEPNLQNLIQRIEDLEESITTNPGHKNKSSPPYALEKGSVPHKSHIVLDKSRIVSASHWKTNTREVVTNYIIIFSVGSH